MGTEGSQNVCRQSCAQTTKPCREQQKIITSNRIPSQHTGGETLECLTCGLGTSGDRAPQQGTPVQLPPAVPRSLGSSGGWCSLGCSHVPHDAQGERAREQSQFSTLTSAPPLQNISFAARFWSCWSSSSPSRFSAFPLFLPLKLLLNIMPHMYSLLFFPS